MKLYKLAFVAILSLCMLSFTTVSAQGDREDVVYLKNGNIYRGTIIEQVPNVSLKIETIGGNVFSVQISDVAKFTKEEKQEPEHRTDMGRAEIHHDGMHEDHFYRDDMHREHYYHGWYGAGDSMHQRSGFHYRMKGYFNTAQLLIENLMGGGRLVNGYKFGQFGYLGVGIGFDIIFNDMRRNNSNYSGVYLPLYLHYGGDILRKRITPFYSIEAGYAMKVNPGNNNGMFPGGNMFNNNSNITNGKGGMMGGAGFGVKFYSKHKIFISLSAHADFQDARYSTMQYLYNSAGNYYYNAEVKSHTMLMIPGIRFGLGF
jgi:hypothetical protein